MSGSSLFVERRHKFLLPWPQGTKPQRRTELGLLVFTSFITVVLYVMAEVGTKNKIPPHLGPLLAVILGISLVAHLGNRWLVPDANPVVLPISALLNGIGYVVITRWTPPAAKAQATWAVLGVGLYLLTLVVIRHSRDLDRYRYMLLLIAAILLVAPLVPGVGVNITGVRLFVHLGPVQFQPVEIGKLLLCIFFASYFAENKEMLSIPTARLGNRLFIDPRPLIPILIAWALTMAVIGVEDDLGFAMLIFTLFVGLLWISTGRVAYLILAIVLFGLGAFGAAHFFHQVHTRVETWLHPAFTSQLGLSAFAMAHGGVGGAGLGLDPTAGAQPGGIPYITSDMVFAAIADEMGLAGGAVIVMCFLFLVGSGLRIAQTARSDFSKLLATGLTIIMGFQAFFIMAGVIRLLPLTGITLPFVAYGGSSLIANYILIALLMRVSQEGSINAAEEALGVRLPTDAPFMTPSA